MVDVAGFGALRLTKASLPILRGLHTVKLRHDLAITHDQKGRESKQPQPGHRALFKHLRVLRKQIANEQSVPPYIVFGDRTLVAMAEMVPRTLTAFAALPGVGKVKLDRYGNRFLQAIADFEAWSTDSK